MNKKLLEKENNLEIGCLGLFSFSSATKLVWEINQISLFNFIRVRDSSIESKQGISYHTRFEYFLEDYGSQLIILKNKGSKIDLIKNNIDIPYLVYVLDGEFEAATLLLSEKLKKLENVKALQVLDSKFINKLVAYI